MTEYKLATGVVNGRDQPLVLVGTEVFTLERLLGPQSPGTLLQVIQDWPRQDRIIETAAAALKGEKGLDPQAIEYRTPIANPPKVICVGTNYRDHLTEMKTATVPAFPYAFFRPSTSLAAHDETIRLPHGPKMIDWEAELGFIIGSRVERGVECEPLDVIAAYTVINDISARDWIRTRPQVGIDWVMQKAWDRFQPTGPWITPARFVDNPQNLAIVLTVNGAIKQQSNTSEMIFGVRDIVRHLSSIMTLEPGDIIATGTPAGVGFGKDPPEFIKPGDRVVVSIDRLGRLENDFI